MYQPEKYKNNEAQFIYDLMDTNPFAIIVINGGRLLATHVPVLIEGSSENYRFFAHVANHNPMCAQLHDGMEMLIIFSGPDAYVSSSWYAEPDIPTWDYTAVHVNGKVKMQTAHELQKCLDKLLFHFEKDKQNPMDRNKISAEVWDENFRGITGFWLEPQKVVGISKLHQGFEKKDIDNITNQLDAQGCPAQNLSALIKKQHDTNN